MRIHPPLLVVCYTFFGDSVSIPETVQVKSCVDMYGRYLILVLVVDSH